MDNMEEKTGNKTHKVLLSNRKTGNFSGVVDVLSFDVAEILLETEQGMLLIKGSDLHVNRLSLEKGEVDVDFPPYEKTWNSIYGSRGYFILAHLCHRDLCYAVQGERRLIALVCLRRRRIGDAV